MAEHGEPDNFGSCLSDFVDNGSVESHRYYLVRRTVLEMLKDRGYAVPNADIEVSLQEFRAKFGQNPDTESLKISALHSQDPSIKTLVIFCPPTTVKMDTVRSIAAGIHQETLNRLILVLQDKITSPARNHLLSLKCKVEIFHVTDLIVNITKHDLKPKHQPLDDEEKKELLEKFSIDEKQLPRMSSDDAIARYYGLEKGKVLKVSYGGEITQLHVSYRCVC